MLFYGKTMRLNCAYQVSGGGEFLTMPNATPLNAVWYSKLGVGNSGVGYAKSNKKLKADQK